VLGLGQIESQDAVSVVGLSAFGVNGSRKGERLLELTRREAIPVIRSLLEILNPREDKRHEIALLE
jgi:hypothetical protein